MSLKGFKPEWIRKLHNIGRGLEGVEVRMPTEVEVLQAKQDIEKILPPKTGNHEVTIPYVQTVLVGLEFAETQYRYSMLDDIKAGKRIRKTNYKGAGTK